MAQSSLRNSNSSTSSSALEEFTSALKIAGNKNIAKLKCLTSIKCSAISFGFTAASMYFPIDILKNIDSVHFSHHEQLLTIICQWPGVQQLKMELKYGVIKNFNFETSINSSNICDTTLIVSFIPCPLFFYGEMEKGANYYLWYRFDPQTLDKNGLWGKFIKCSSLNFQFSLNKSTFDSLLCSLTSAGCSITYNATKYRQFNDAQIEDFYEKVVSKWPWTLKHCIAAIKSTGTVGSFFLHHVLFLYNEINNVIDNGYLNEAWALKLFTAMFEFISSDISLPSLEFNGDNYEFRRHTDPAFVMVKTLYITPTRRLFLFEDATMNCRGFRKLGVENLLQVKFRDDNLMRFPAVDNLLHESVRNVCFNGIEVCGRQFYEVGSSSSLFRDYGTYFYAADSKDLVVKKWKEFGEFKVEPVAKVQARIGLNFTSAREIAFQLRQDNFILIDDIMCDSKDSAGKNYCFSDGCGIIAPFLARLITDKLELSYTPSAFQFRFLGFKGMVSVDLTDPRLAGNEGDGNYFLLLRHSQKKFEVTEKGLFDFDVVSFSAPAPTRLHGTFIAMINALAILNGKEQSVHRRLHELQNQTFVENIKPLVDNQACWDTLQKLPKYVPIDAMKTKYLLHQPFFREMIEANAVFNSRLLASKNQISIPIDLGRAAYGIVDITGSLKENEVFFQFSKSLRTSKKLNKEGQLKNDVIIKEGRVMITKSPIVHGGDIRFLQAKYYKALEHLVDVIVFPACGNRPHPDKIGGGDLDGDHYSIIWDPDLLMEMEFKPNDFTSPSTDDILTVDLDNLQKEAANFRVEYMKQNNLEKLSTAHSAHILLHGPNHKNCVDIGKKIDLAVNYFKSGQVAENLTRDERVTRWPMCQNKRHEPAYTNNHILSEVSKHSTTFSHLISIAQGKAQEKRQKFDLIDIKKLKISKWHRTLFDEYKREVTAIMKRYNVKTQGELFSNSITNIPGTLRDYKDPMGDDGSASALIQQKIFDLFEKYRTKILNLYAPHAWQTEMQLQNKNIFTYKIKDVSPDLIQVAQTFYAMAAEEEQFYSFPWIAWEGLDAWWSDQENPKSYTTKAVFEDEIKKMIKKNRHYGQLFEEFSKKYPQYPWFRYFAVMFTNFMELNALQPELVSDAVEKFMNSLEASDVERSVISPKSENQAFFDFLVSCVTCNEQDKNLYQAAQSTLINFAFFSKNMFKVNLRQEIMEYPYFVISIPEYWREEYENNYMVLLEKSGVEEIDTAVRKSFKYFKNYTIICRGTLKSCQNLESMLTPIIEPDFYKSIKQMNQLKNEKNRDMLIDVFGFSSRNQRSFVPFDSRKRRNSSPNCGNLNKRFRPSF